MPPSSIFRQKQLSLLGDIDDCGEEFTYHPTAIGLFAGCGGLDYGFKKAGFNILYANDILKCVEDTYRLNVGEIEIKSIVDVDKKALPEVDVVLAGIPCQPFSNAGKRKSTNDHRGNLFEQVVEVLECKRPKVVVFENVRGFLSSRDENGMLMPERIKKDLLGIGYNLYYKLLNASDYEVPQNRYRVFLVGVREDVDKERGFVFPEPIIDKSELVVGKIIGRPLPEGDPVEILALPPQVLKIIGFIPEGGSWKSIPDEHLPERFKKIKDQMKRYRSPNFYRRFRRDEIMGTITASATPENSGIMHPLENRRYSVREIARFQSFPDDFRFVGASTREKYLMIGNAVPVNLAYHMAKSILCQYFYEETEKERVQTK